MARIIGLTGGIGSGKSAAADLFVARGAVLVDADVVAREVVEPGGPAYQPLRDAFGDDIVDASGAIDRQRLADVAFASPECVSTLNAITHPAIGLAMLQQIASAVDAHADGVVIVAIPLLAEVHRASLNLDDVVVVDCPVEICVERLIAHRQFSERDARARIEAQISREARRQMADHVIDNSQGLDDLARQVDELWPQLVAGA